MGIQDLNAVNKCHPPDCPNEIHQSLGIRRIETRPECSVGDFKVEAR